MPTIPVTFKGVLTWDDGELPAFPGHDLPGAIRPVRPDNTLPETPSTKPIEPPTAAPKK